MKQTNKIFIGVAAVVLASSLWGVDAVFLRVNLVGLPTTVVVFLEHFLGFIALFPFLLIYSHQLGAITKKQWLAIVATALLGGVMGTVFFTKALFLTDFKNFAEILLLQKLQPLFAWALAALFLRERFPGKFYLYAAAAMAGGYLITFPNPLSPIAYQSISGAVAGHALLAAVFFGAATIVGKYAVKKINQGLLACLRYGLAALIIAIPASRFLNDSVMVGSARWQTIAAVVFFAGPITLYLYYYGLKKIPASLAVIGELFWPFLFVVISYFTLGAWPNITQILGTLLLTAAAWQAAKINYPHTIQGTIKAGFNQGYKVGVRTANLDVGLAGNLPFGLYACKVVLGNQAYQGLMYYGVNCLVKKLCLEVHLLDFDNDIYGKNIIITTTRYLRRPKNFTNAEELKKQIQKDLAAAKKFLL